MVGKYQVTAIRDEQPSFDGDRHRLHNRLIFLDESERIENHPATNDARRFGLENAGRDQMQYVPAISEVVPGYEASGDLTSQDHCAYPVGVL